MTEAWGATPVPVREGDVLAGKFRIERILGVGGMGVVVQAHHLQLDERVAIKFLLPQALGSPDVVARFVREARTAIKIKSEHVARVIDVGTLETGAPYMVMEYLEGTDLGAWVRNNGQMPSETAAEFILQACEALAEAHALGIVHRDLKPANLFVVRRADGLQAIRVLDFGISKVRSMDGGQGGMTSTTAVMGSPSYMSPEQLVSSRDVDPRSDIWALGVTMYEVMTGRVPFDGETMTAVCMKVVQAQPPPLRAMRPDVPPELEAVVMRCLQKQREDRFLNVAELALALAPFGPKRARGSVERIARTIGATLPSGSPDSSRAPMVPSPASLVGAMAGGAGVATSPGAGAYMSGVPGGATGAGAAPGGAAPGGAATGNAATNAAWGQSQSTASSPKRAVLVTVAIAATLVLVGGGVLALRRTSSSDGAAAGGNGATLGASGANAAAPATQPAAAGQPVVTATAAVQPGQPAVAATASADPASAKPGTEPAASASAATTEAARGDVAAAGPKGHAAPGRPAPGTRTKGPKGPAVDSLIDDCR